MISDPPPGEAIHNGDTIDLVISRRDTSAHPFMTLMFT